MTTLQEIIAGPPLTTVGVSPTNVSRQHTDARQLVADPTTTTVTVGATLDTAQEGVQTVGALGWAVLIDLASDADAVFIRADTTWAVLVHDTALTSARIEIAIGGVIFVALLVREALYTAVTLPIAALSPWAV